MDYFCPILQWLINWRDRDIGEVCVGDFCDRIMRPEAEVRERLNMPIDESRWMAERDECEDELSEY